MRPRLAVCPGRARPRGFSARHSGRDGPNEGPDLGEQARLAVLRGLSGRPRQA